MNAIERFQRIRDYIDTQNICDELSDFLSEDELHEFCGILEENYEIEYDDENYIDYDM